MVKKSKKIIQKKARKPQRMSIMGRTVEEGKEYAQQAGRVLPRIAKRKQEYAETLLRMVPASKPRIQKKKKSVKKNPSRPSQNAPARTQKAVQKINHVPIPQRTGSAQSILRTSSKNNPVIEQELHDRLNLHGATFGELNFSLRWWDPNDLDLHVTCPCGTEIFYAMKKCETCNGELDIDMNAAFNMSLEPVEHIFFKKAKKGLYKFFVKYYHGPKTHSGATGGSSSKYALSLHSGIKQIFKYEDTVSNTNPQIHYDFQL